jgi:conjugal transfer mating pair stabilization protein TraN
LLAFPIAVAGQSPTQAAKSDGKAFGGTAAPGALATARTPPNATDLPNFTTSPAQQSYYSAPATLEPAGVVQAPGSVGYRAVTESLATRATFSASEINTVVAVGQTIVADPFTYVSGFTAGGSQGTCVPLPSSAISPGTYEQTCNTGYTSGPPVSHVCNIPLRVTTATTYKYECSSFDAAANGVNDCALFPMCSFVSQRPGICLVSFGPPGFGCAEPGEPIYVFSCPAPVTGGTLLGTDVVVTGAAPDASACSAWSTDPQCAPDPDVCTDSTPVTRLVGGVPVTQPCWAWARTYQCTAPLVAMSDCNELDALGCTFLREQCITGELPCLTVDRVYSCPIPPVPQVNQQICDADVYCINGECDTIDRTPNTEFADAVVALNAIGQAGKEFNEATLEILKGDRLTCSKTIFGLTNCCVPRGFPLLGGCNAEDIALKDRREDGQCTYVGTFCDQKVLGICLRKKEAHCCFLSKISRILQEQGRPQIGKAWGNPKTEQCAGFTIAEFQQLNLALMDFSEVYAEFVDAAKVPAELDVMTEIQAKISAYYASNGL